ncbi:MAG: nucleotidyltransferase family protein [Candidatus Aminicenantaceae bacterium]
MKIKELPEKFESTVTEVASLLLARYKDTRAIITIGSFADGTYNKKSDIDLVWIKSRKLDYKKQFRIEEELERISDRKIQLVPFSSKQIRWHFQHSTTMAHAIQKGIIIYGKENGLMSALLKKKLDHPTQEWMKSWFEHWQTRYRWAKDSIRREKRLHKKFCKTECTCTFFDDIARVAVNFAILYLETRKIIPLSKKQIMVHFEKCLSPRSSSSTNVLKGLALAIELSGRDRFLKASEIEQILLCTNWLEKKLNKIAKRGK